MEPKEKKPANRRDVLKILGAGAAVLTGSFPLGAAEYPTPWYAKGMPPVKIKNIKAIATAPAA